MPTAQSPLNNTPPLRGDGCGGFRVHVVGNSGVGKSTLSRELAGVLGVHHIALDSLYFLPGWQHSSPEEFRAKVRAAMDEDVRGWVIDGNWTRLLGTVVQDEATDVIWLDPPLVLYFPRLCARTLLRLLSLEPPCAPGCKESAREVFLSRESIIWWCLSHHWVVRRREAERMRVDGIHVCGKRRRIGGWGGELEAWKQGVRSMRDARAHQE